MSNIPFGESPRTVHAANSGSNDNRGFDPINAKESMNDISPGDGAISTVLSIDPPPGLTAPAAIYTAPGTRLIENITLPDNVQFNPSGPAIQGAGGTVVRGAANSQASFLSISTTSLSGDIGYSTNGKSRISLDSRAIILNGPNQIGSDISDSATEQSSEVFQTVGQILARFDGSTCVNYTATGLQPRRIQYNEINMEGQNSIGIRYAATASSVAAFECGAITDTGGSGNIGVKCEDGQISGYLAEINVETAIHVSSGGHLDITVPNINGDIVVDAGGELNISCAHHESGIVINAGEINGNIGGVEYGSYVDIDLHILPFSRRGVIPSGGENVGRLTIDTTSDTLLASDIIATYSHITTSTHTVEFRIKDADNLATIYFSGSTTTSVIDTSTVVTMSAVTPLPAATVVNLFIEVERTSGSTSGVLDPSIVVQFTRTP